MRTAAIQRRLVLESCRSAMWNLLLTLCAFLVRAEITKGADPPPQNKPATLSDVERKALLVERYLFRDEAADFRSQGKYAEAIASAEKMLAIERRLFGNIAEDIADSMRWIGQCQLAREDFGAARMAFQEECSIRSKLHGEQQWRSVDARVAMHDAAMRGRMTLEQRQELARAASLNQDVVRLYRRGDFREAVRLAEQVVDVRKQILGAQHSDTAIGLNNLALLYDETGQYTKAGPLYEQSLAIYRKVLGEQHPNTAMALNNLACLYLSMGQYKSAEPLFQQALSIRKSALGAQSSETAESLNNLAELYRVMVRYAKARPLYEQALAIYRKVRGEEYQGTVGCLNNLALLYDLTGQYAKAEPLYKQSLAIRRKVLGEEHPETAQSLNNLAALYHSTCQYAKAERLYEQSLAIRKKVLGEQHPDTATSLNNLASLYESMRQYRDAESLYQQALAIRRNVFGEEHPDTAASLNNLANLYRSVGEYATAEPLYQQALATNRKIFGESANTAISLSNLAGLHLLRGDVKKAETLEEQAFSIRKNALGDQHPDTAISLKALGFLKELEGEHAEAATLLKQALASSQRFLVETFGILSEREQLALEADARNNLDFYLSVAGTSEYRAATAPSLSDSEIYRYVLLGKGIVTAQQAFIHVTLRAKHSPELEHLFQELQEDGRQLQTLQLSPPKQPEKLEAWRQEISRVGEERNATQQKLAAQSSDFRLLELSLQVDAGQVKKLEARLPPKTGLVDVLEYTHIGLPPEKNGPLLRERRLVAFVVRSASVKRVDLGPIAPLVNAAEQWRRAIVQGHGDAHQIASVPSAAGVSEKLPQQFLREHLIDPLLPYIQGVEWLLVSPDGFLNQVPLAALPGRNKGTFLIEDMGIAVIPVPRELPAMLSTKPIDVLRDPSLLMVGAVDFGGDPGMVSFAMNDSAPAQPQHRAAVRGPNGYIFGPLPGTAQEIDGIGKTFRTRFGTREIEILDKTNATEEKFRSEAPRHRFLHLATHGFFAPAGVHSALDRQDEDRQRAFGDRSGLRSQVTGLDPGLLSGLAFAGANHDPKSSEDSASTPGKETDDGIMTALEISELDLRNVDLAVLSACETGLGRVAGGEGVLGLQRAFQTAGARTCITSLWKVDDTATQLLMKEFYTNLWEKKLGKLEALRQAQLTMLHQYDPGERKLAQRSGLARPGTSAGFQRGAPFFWAPFVLSGDWR